MYGADFDFSNVLLPGVGGTLNAATAITSDKLAEMNKSGKKWGTDKEGNLSYHNEAKLEHNKKSREKRKNLINRDRNENADSEQAMNEIMGRKRARMASFMDLKRKEYNFADDTELMSMPQPFAHGECSASCEGPGKCNCHSCKAKVAEDREFREWTMEKRKKLQSGDVKGEFAGPGMSFPISSPQDVSAAWASVGRAANPRKVMAEIIRIAQKFNWMSGLPKTVRDRLKGGESGLPSLEYREWPSKKRVGLEKGEIKGEFAGPGLSFPIAGPQDVAAAWASVGRAKDPRKTMIRILSIAKKYGWESGLPEAVKQRIKSGKSGLPE